MPGLPLRLTRIAKLTKRKLQHATKFHCKKWARMRAPFVNLRLLSKIDHKVGTLHDQTLLHAFKIVTCSPQALASSIALPLALPSGTLFYCLHFIFYLCFFDRNKLGNWAASTDRLDKRKSIAMVLKPLIQSLQLNTLALPYYYKWLRVILVYFVLIIVTANFWMFICSRTF